MSAVKIPGDALAMVITVLNVPPPGSVMVATARPAAVPLGTMKLIWPLEAKTPYSSERRPAPALSVMFTVTPPSAVVSGNEPKMSSFNLLTPNRLAISSAAKLADRLAAAFITAGSGVDWLLLKLPSPAYTAVIGRPSTVDATLATTIDEALPP